MLSRRDISADQRLRIGLLAFCLGGAVFLAGCASAPPYRPADGPGAFGYRAAALSDDHYRVAYAGDHGVPRSNVEKFALYRAAKVTLGHGASRFRIVSRETSPVTTTRGYPSAHVGFGLGWGSPFFGGVGFPIGVSSATRYETVLIIQFGPGVADSGADVYKARSVVQNLADLIDRNDGDEQNEDE